MSELTHGAGEIISYLEMCQAWSASFQRGMNFRVRPDRSVILMSRRANALYRDRIEQDGKILIYEGHDIARKQGGPDPKSVDQPSVTFAGRPTQNGLFEKAAQKAKQGSQPAEVVAVYEKIHQGIWAFNGFFELTDSWIESDGRRNVFKFQLELGSPEFGRETFALDDIQHNRLIPSAVKLEVWKRDRGSCVLCGARDNLHFDHDLPFSKGGSSILVANIRLLCARHNLEKHDRIE